MHFSHLLATWFEEGVHAINPGTTQIPFLLINKLCFEEEIGSLAAADHLTWAAAAK